MYGAGAGRIWLDNVRCTGRESDIGSCPHRGWGVHSCSHSEDVSISCITTETQAIPGKNEYSAHSMLLGIIRERWITPDTTLLSESQLSTDTMICNAEVGN